MINGKLNNLIVRFPELAGAKESIHRAFHLIRDAFGKGGKLLVCGNGGSASDADHIVGELMKSFSIPRAVPDHIHSHLEEQFGKSGLELGRKLEGALPAISLNAHQALISAVANDIDAHLVFGQQIIGYGRPEDVLWGLSTSGNSRNICNAFMIAKAAGLKTLGLTGRDGGQFNQLCDVVINVGGTVTARIQELHLPVYHTLCEMLESSLFKSDPNRV